MAKGGIIWLFGPILAFFVLFEQCEAGIFSKKWSSELNRIIKLEKEALSRERHLVKHLFAPGKQHVAGHGRVRRDTHKQNDIQGGNVIVHTSYLDNKVHNEAIVHWSGKASNVSLNNLSS